MSQFRDEGRDPYEFRENRSQALMKKVLIYSALFISFPIYLAFLFFPDLSQSFKQVARRSKIAGLEISELGGMNFSSIKQKPIKNSKKLAEETIFQVALSDDYPNESLYLRVGSFDTFSRHAMESTFARNQEKGWPHFAFESGGSGRSEKAVLYFYKNYEPRLPYVPSLKKFAGILGYSSRKDGSVQLEATIAAGDEFEIEFISPGEMKADDEIVENNSEYLDLEPLNREKIEKLAAQISPQSDRKRVALQKFVEWLAENGTYKTEVEYGDSRRHPVEEFLESGMKGHCQFFAASLVALARSRGIPARVGTGYVSTVKNVSDFLVTGGMAHAWPEILTKNGWKIVDVKVKKSESSPVVAPQVAWPDKETLDRAKKQGLRQNRDLVKENPGIKEARIDNETVTDEEVADPAEPGTVVKNLAKNEAFKKKLEKSGRPERAEMIKRRLETERGQKVFSATIGLLVLPLIIYIIMNPSRFFTWLSKIFRTKTEEERAEEQFQQQAIEELEKMLEKNEPQELAGQDIAEIFRVFNLIMSSDPVFARGENETAAEYFDRLARILKLDLRQLSKIAALFDSEVYGRYQISADDFKRFGSCLKQIIEKVKAYDPTAEVSG
ncbi:MAG: transglutaminase domain-containing protein [Candidatus Riflebacteria bacterium]